jgi:hypothetical protein
MTSVFFLRSGFIFARARRGVFGCGRGGGRLLDPIRLGPLALRRLFLRGAQSLGRLCPAWGLTGRGSCPSAAMARLLGILVFDLYLLPTAGMFRPRRSALLRLRHPFLRPRGCTLLRSSGCVLLGSSGCALILPDDALLRL